MASFEIPYYHDYISPSLAAHLLHEAKPTAVSGLVEVGHGGGLETPDALRFLTRLYQKTKGQLGSVLQQRRSDRQFLDERVLACAEFNRDLQHDWLSPEYQTVLGLEDANGRIVIGPKNRNYCRRGGAQIAPLPDFLKGPHVTLFGPPDSAKMAINAMNSFHRQRPDEPGIVAELLGDSAPMWGADDEDSKTPLRADLVDAAVNLTKCFAGTLSLTEGEKKYELANDHLAQPIKRFPGLALPCNFLFFEGSPIPLHLYDFALHLFHNWQNPKALVFYVPKLENEEEAAYIHKMIEAAEEMISALHPEYLPGTVRLMIVLENPRAILRAHEIMDALYPYFAGASLGWHDYLASTARIFKNDSNYRIPVKADPDIVIKYIKASHHLLAEAIGSRGGIKVGGMYGILPAAGEESLQVTLKGFFKDVITQMKRDLTGFWVAHPDFVRLGLALVEAWKRRIAGDEEPMNRLIAEMLSEKHKQEVLEFLRGPDIEGLDPSDQNYVRSLIVADIRESDFIPNNHPDEIRYNVFQSLQYLTDWLSGNGCVALPTSIGNVPVRVMDDLATAERSRWEVWHELHHGRFSLEEFLQICHEEMNFIRRDLSNEKKIVQVKWDDRTAKWYPIAQKIMLQLMASPSPVEFATELLLPFTVEAIRNAPDPWKKALELAPEKFTLPEYAGRFDHYFEICGAKRFAELMAKNSLEDLTFAENIVRSFSQAEILSAASFHGDIGQSKATLDKTAAREQAGAFRASTEILAELKDLGAEYLKKFGFKFLLSAQGKSAEEMLSVLKARVLGTASQELNNAREALWEISRKRLLSHRMNLSCELLAEKLASHGISGASIAINSFGAQQALSFGQASAGKMIDADSRFELASLSKTLASAFALEYFQKRKLSIESPVNHLFAEAGSDFRLHSDHPHWADSVTVENLLNHSALNLHYVKGFHDLPPVRELIEGNHGYEPVEVISAPGSEFHYSGGGYLVLELLLSTLLEKEGKTLEQATESFLNNLGLTNTTFASDAGCVTGHLDSGEEVPGGHLNFPAFAAGAKGTALDFAKFLAALTKAYQQPTGAGISHDTAAHMLLAMDRGCQAFMGCDMGLGIFVADAGPNRIAIHQGANEGFRALYCQCVAGPDAGKGFVILANGDNRAVPFIAEAAQEIFRSLHFSGIDFSRFAQSFEYAGLDQEQIVNLGYKSLVFDAFEKRLPEPILRRGEPDPMAPYNLAAQAKILVVSNQRFARAENLISPMLPTFEADLFGREGKIMDSWESVRHNPLECDSLRLGLATPSKIRYVSLSTKFHDGNHPEFVRIYGLQQHDWLEILPKTKIDGHSLLLLDLGENAETYLQVIVDMFPDGGLSRLGLFADLPEEEKSKFLPPGKARNQRFSDAIPKTKKPLTIPYRPIPERSQRYASLPGANLASLAAGATLVSASNEHYGPAAQVISPFPPIHMFDGLESARSRIQGHHEEVRIRLAKPTQIERILLDFSFFVNNNPMHVSIEGWAAGKSFELVAKTKVKAFAGNQKEFFVESPLVFEEITVKAFPDGGINRIKVWAPAPAH